MFVFTVTTGHSGTMYLAKLLESCPNSYVVHEPGWTKPDGRQITDPPLELATAYQRAGATQALHVWYDRVRVPTLTRVLANQADHYVETGQLLCKADLGYLLSKLPVDLIRLVHLRRDAYSTAFSLRRNGAIPGTPTVEPWWGWPWAESNLLRWRLSTRAGDRPLTACVWLWLEVEARALTLAELYPLRTVELAALNSKDEVLALCRWLGIGAPPQLDYVVGKPVNAKQAKVEAVLAGAGGERFAHLAQAPKLTELIEAIEEVGEQLEERCLGVYRRVVEATHGAWLPPGMPVA